MRTTIFIAGLLAIAGLRATGRPAKVTFADIEKLAAARAAAPFQAGTNDLPPAVGQLTYDQYQAIQFREDRTVWRAEDLPFQLQLFPRGGLYHDRIVAREFDARHDQVIRYEPENFDFTAVAEPGLRSPDLGYAGLRVLYQLNRPEAYDEVIAFLGASYFRAIGAGENYGLSARGIAVDAALPNRVEEFPRFTDFWLEKPEANATRMTIYALLDGPSVAGAYAFEVTPGTATSVDVRAKVFFRTRDKLVGFAPLTSMFWYGENTERPADDHRPEVHDSDGLLIDDSTAPRVWRPLHAPAEMETAQLAVNRLRGFGLLQRDRDPVHYDDQEASYVHRPSAWIEPQGTWTAGTVRLAELPATREYADNVVAYWVPAQSAGNVPAEFSYRIVWGQTEIVDEALARVTATHEAPLANAAHGRVFSIDFADRKSASRDPRGLEAKVDVGAGGRLRRSAVTKIPGCDGWRVAIEVEAERAGQDIELHCQLRDGHGQIGETWWYGWKS